MKTWTTLVALVALIYASREHFKIGKYVASTFGSLEDQSTQKEERTSVTGFFQSTGVFLRPLSDASEVATHLVTFPLGKLAPLASFTRPLDSGIVHFTGSTVKFWKVSRYRSGR
jgi:hypothetical protein